MENAELVELLEKRLFSGKEAAYLAGMDPRVLTAWAMRGIIVPASTELVSIRRKNFRYDIKNLLEIIIKKRLSDCFSIKYDMLEILTRDTFGPKKELLERVLELKDPCLLILAKIPQNITITSGLSKPDLEIGEKENKILFEVKLCSWGGEVEVDMLNSDVSLFVDLWKIKNRIIRNYQNLPK